MKKSTPPKNVLFLTSEQIGELLAKGFWGFLDSTRRFYREDVSATMGLPEENVKGKVTLKQAGPPSIKKVRCEEHGKEKLFKLKGRVPIRSNTIHDQNRHHQ